MIAPYWDTCGGPAGMGDCFDSSCGCPCHRDEEFNEDTGEWETSDDNE